MSLVFLCLSAVFAVVAINGTPIPDIGPMATVARCRANCLQRMIRPAQPFNDESCQDRKACRICWDMCYYLIVSPNAFSAVCTTNNCQRGCKVACHFRDVAPEVPKSSVHWKFALDPTIQKFTSTQKMQIKWSKPEPQEAIKNRYAFVYILLAKATSQRSSQDWTQVLQVASTDLVIDQDMVPHNPEFWLLAVNKNGTVADIRFGSQSHIIKDVIDVPRKEDLPLNPVGGMSEDTPIHVNVSVTADSSDGTLTGVIEWEHPPITSNSTLSYVVHWFLDDCEVYVDSPICTIPPQHFASTVIIPNKQKPSFRIEGELVYNAQYKVRIELDSNWYGEVDFFTEFCENVDERTYTVCYDVESQEGTTVEPHSENKKDKDPNSYYDPLTWSVNLASMRFDSKSKMVIAEINWTVPFNQSIVYEYTVRSHSENVSQWLNVDFKYTEERSITLKLFPHKVYEISVIAAYRTNQGEEEVSKSEILTFNTSWVDSMPMAWRAESVILRKGETLKDLNGVIIGITCVISIILLGLIMLFIYKKRHSFKDIIITKTAVAKSNSYKSNVGCKVDYSNQLLIMSDEWELDPRLLKFSSPIGQGAFGKVVTGYYNNQRVAIKLIRDSAPLSYKEDLLAEINLMKRIGSHSNIVSMNGACTLSEPIALVMEYVPYGNLQNFLKKCRLEGDFQRKIGRPSEVVYSVMDDNGDIDSGVITPADMLSFARQVAMAMEYLAAKKYVHRDLAARNVLLGYDKVVKVCDFGLSRDIYNDNQYHKLTSGKLPLKWMAIESLRERIFTTQSDVWSFGILLWEIITMGGSPYPNIALADLYYVLANGYRMEKPSNCSDELCIIMHQCWIENPTDRPSFTELRLQLEQLLSRDRNYLELENIDVPLSTSDSSSVPKSDDSDTLSLLSTKPSQHRIIPTPSHSKTSGLVPVGKTGAMSSSNSTVQGPTKKVAIKDAVTICIDQSTDWLVPGREDETTS